MTDYTAFAERCRLAKRVAMIVERYFAERVSLVSAEPTATSIEFNDDGHKFGEPFTTRDLAEFADLAERHARLLAQIAAWANSPFDDRHHALSPANAGNAGKAHIRAILEQT